MISVFISIIGTIGVLVFGFSALIVNDYALAQPNGFAAVATLFAASMISGAVSFCALLFAMDNTP